MHLPTTLLFFYISRIRCMPSWYHSAATARISAHADRPCITTQLLFHSPAFIMGYIWLQRGGAVFVEPRMIIKKPDCYSRFEILAPAARYRHLV
ncbi:uncharacterized protein TrAFT101_005029 [Trichoderma asperellum]|nr:hypothetical protein TrAFT101_005029 [Trichoderma asperellum]